MKMKEEEINQEIEKFHIQLLKNVIKVIKLNQKEIKKQNTSFFNNGAVCFGDVIILEINHEIGKIRKREKGL